MNIFFPINFTFDFGCSKEPSHGDGSFEYPQHMFWLRTKEIDFLIMCSYLEACRVLYCLSRVFIAIQQQFLKFKLGGLGQLSKVKSFT